MYNFEEIKRLLKNYQFTAIYTCWGTDPNWQYDVIYCKDGVTIKYENTGYNFLEIVGMKMEHLVELNKMCVVDDYAPLDQNYLDTYDSEQDNQFKDFTYEDYYGVDEEYEEFVKNVTPTYCNIISAMVCYMNGEFTRKQLIADIMRSTDNNKDVIEHLETIL